MTCFTKPWDHNPFSLDVTAGLTEISAGWRWNTGRAEVGHLLTYRSPIEFSPAEAASLQIRIICHALLDILPEDGLRPVLDALGEECSRYGGIDPRSGFLVRLADTEDPYANTGLDRMRAESSRVFNSVLRARPSGAEDREL